ncbi:MAG: septum formation initiator family protein [candidate division Zixibacteria bacterium]|nr:septum formation initiator family protein [candidate division Zixibacteria bacterium]
MRKKNPRKNVFFERLDKNVFSQKKILRRLFFLLVLFLIFYLYFVGDYGFLRLLSLKKEKDSLILETKKLQAQNMDSEMEIGKLKEDLFYIEKVARERYGMAKEDELIYKFIQPQDNSSTPFPEETK